ncbi:hypothetical protein R5R35_005985 [Gryllus longicercus]|uniref:Pickpocket n=1 Tax=Gryllus longicercus TaxID=2509291 RepID=A0AAN9Z4H9_9ORTH
MSIVDPEKAALYERFVAAVGNLTYDNLHLFREFENETGFDQIKSEMEDIAVQVQNRTLPTPGKVGKQVVNITPILGEFGIAYTFASPVARYISPRPLRDNPKLRDKYKADIVNCQVVGFSCTSYTGFPVGRSVKYSVHSPYEVQQASDKFEYGFNGSNLIFYIASQIISDVEVYKLKLSQRHCFLQTEPSDDLPFSSFNICLMKCRRRLAIRLCGCAPFFYNSLGGNKKVCNAKGLACLSRHVKHLQTLYKEVGGVEKKESCRCIQPCEHIKYEVRTAQVAPAGFHVMITYGMKEFSTTRYIKRVLFGIEDLLVSYGGTAGFFLGCSLLSVFELVYFFTLRLVCVVFCHSRGSKGGDRQKRRLQREQWFQSLHPNLKEPFY